MTSWLSILTHLGDKAGAVGGLVSAMGCGMCFPAIASLGAALGMGFLQQWEGLFINQLLPLFAWVALGANALAWFSHRRWVRSLLGMLGPSVALLSLYPWFAYAWSTQTLYASLAWMLGFAVWDMIAPAQRQCAAITGQRQRT